LLRDAALKVVGRIGVWQDIGVAQGAVGNVKLLFARLGSLEIAHRTPFQRIFWADDQLKYRAAQLGMTLPLPYGLDVWAPKKVLNIEWDDKGTVALTSLRPGSLETELIGLSEAEAADRRPRVQAASVTPLDQGLDNLAVAHITMTMENCLDP
jgi:hypothetical protein